MWASLSFSSLIWGNLELENCWTCWIFKADWLIKEPVRLAIRNFSTRCASSRLKRWISWSHSACWLILQTTWKFTSMQSVWSAWCAVCFNEFQTCSYRGPFQFVMYRPVYVHLNLWVFVSLKGFVAECSAYKQLIMCGEEKQRVFCGSCGTFWKWLICFCSKYFCNAWLQCSVCRRLRMVLQSYPRFKWQQASLSLSCLITPPPTAWKVNSVMVWPQPLEVYRWNKWVLEVPVSRCYPLS